MFVFSASANVIILIQKKNQTGKKWRKKSAFLRVVYKCEYYTKLIDFCKKNCVCS